MTEEKDDKNKKITEEESVQDKQDTEIQEEVSEDLPLIEEDENDTEPTEVEAPLEVEMPPEIEIPAAPGPKKKISKISSAGPQEEKPEKPSKRIELKGKARKKKRSPKAVVIIGLIMLLGLIFFGGYFFGAKMPSLFGLFDKKEETKDTSDKKDKDTKKEEETIKIDKGAVKIDVLNGNGVKGESGVVANALKGSGWTVLNATNADNYEYTQTLIKFRQGYEGAAKLVAKDLSSLYPASLEQTVGADSKADIVIVLGKDKKVTNASVAIRILNGNGQKGSAQEVAEMIKKSGFQTKEIKNADKFDYPETVISYKPDMKDTAESIAKLIDSKYSANLKEDASLDVDIVILVGLK